MRRPGKSLGENSHFTADSTQIPVEIDAATIHPGSGSDNGKNPPSSVSLYVYHLHVNQKNLDASSTRERLAAVIASTPYFMNYVIATSEYSLFPTANSYDKCNRSRISLGGFARAPNIRPNPAISPTGKKRGCGTRGKKSPWPVCAICAGFAILTQSSLAVCW